MLACRRMEARLTIEVYDTGLGIAADDKDSVFREFRRSKFTAAGANDGLGLGLSIVRRYADLLRVEVGFTSRKGRGTRFSIRFPAEAEVSAEPARMQRSEMPCSLRNRRILVLDDEPLIVESLARDLADRGNIVLRAGSMSEALGHVRNGMPDVAVVDIHLGGGEDGPAVIERMQRELGHRVPTLILTGATDAATLSHLVESRQRWMTKPADPDAIARALAELASGARNGASGNDAGRPLDQLAAAE
jgi:ActR/RegA family two-component response regulator